MSGFEWNKALQKMAEKGDFGPQACCCIGPQNGEPLCPCRMKRVKVKGGRYVEVIDHGPVKSNA